MDGVKTLFMNDQVTVMAKERDRTSGRLKLVLIGNQHVGKTSLLMRYCRDMYNPAYTHTRGGDIFQKDMVVDGRKIKLSLLDTAGQSDVKTLIKSIYRDANGIMVVFDVTNEQSFDMVDDWIYRIEQNTVHSPQMVIVGNKDDLSTNRQIEIARASQRAQTFDVPYYDVSAKTGYNVREAFDALIKETWRNLQKKEGDSFTETIRVGTTEEKQSPCCTS